MKIKILKFINIKNCYLLKIKNSKIFVNLKMQEEKE